MTALFRRRAASFCRVALLMVAAGPLHGQTVSRNADQGDRPGEFVTFVGHYGEVLKLSADWNLDASMHGEAEVINHYPKFRFISDDLFEPFKPKAKDFVPENFSRDRLVQLIVLPWSASSSKSLEELKRLKIKDLESSKVEFRIVDEPWPGYGHLGRKLPKGSFEVFIATPYRLSQLYTTSGAHLVILTAGRDMPSSNAIGRHADQMRMSLRDWVIPETGDETPSFYGPVPAPNVPETGVSLHVLTKPKVWMTWAFVNGLALLLFSVLGAAKRWPRLRSASLSLLVFSNAGALIGGLVGLCFWPFGWFSAHATVPSAAACLFMPLLAWSIGRLRRRRPRRGAMIATAVCGLVSSAFFTYVSLGLDTGSGNSPHLAAFTVLFIFPFFAVAGFLFGLLDSASKKQVNGRTLLTLALLLCTASTLRAQSGVVLIERGTPNPITPPEDDAVGRAKKRLAEKNLDFAAFKGVAEAKLKDAGKLYKYQRVEIKGILAKDDTDDYFEDLFDKQIEPSHLGQKGNTVISVPAWVREAFNGAQDFKDLRADTFGAFSEVAQQTVKELKGQDINEIVAHSWGTEIVFNAILRGDIDPPRRLIVCGMPDRDMEKWVALSRHTGTEVVVYANSRDPAARAARIVGGIVESTETSSERISRERIENKLVDAPRDYDALWSSACRQRICNRYSRKPAPPNPVFNYSYQGGTHDRVEYYKAMIKDGAIPLEDSDALELMDRQEKKIAAEANRLYASAVNREVANENPEAGKARSDLDFLGSLQQGSAVVDDMRDNAKKAHDKWVTDHGAAQKRQAELERIRAELENSRPHQQRLEEMNAEAEQCGFKLTVQNGAFSGFEDSHRRKWAVSNGQALDAFDLKLIFLITRACDALNWPGPVDSNPKICNGSASTLGARKEKLAAIDSGLSGGALECRNEILARAWKISDDKTFGKVVEAFNKRWNKNLKPGENSGESRKSSGSREPNTAPPRSERGGEDNTTVTPPPPPVHDPDGEAKRQLEEMERRKRWGVRPVR